MNGNRICGVIRCCGSSKGSYYFGSPELNLLVLAASQINRVWNDFMTILEENSAWRNLFESIKGLNAFVYQELKPGNPSIQSIFEEALRISQSVINGAEILDIRLVKENALEFVAKYGEAWKEGSAKELEARNRKTFDINKEPPESVGAYVIQTGQPYVVEEVRSDPYYNETFDQATGMIAVPIPGIYKNNRATGVLDIRKTNGRPFNRNAIYMAALLGQQLGIYQSMEEILRELRLAKNHIADQLDELKSLQHQQARSARDQIRIARDLQHQFKTPITQAHARAQALLDFTDDEDLKSLIRLVRGLCGKAKRVSYSTRLFSDLALGNPIQVNPKELRFDALVKILKEANMDIQLMIPSRRRIIFWVDEESFKEAIKSKTLEVDKDLLDQMMSDILDNAAKYSHPNTTVRVSAGWTSTNRFYISVLNKGLTIKSDEVALCVQRGWQSEEAKAVSGLESGIGLYIVDKVMLAHDGHLHILPTTSEHYTEVRLIFPDSRVK
jgi:signal transduction histidine kinase